MKTLLIACVLLLGCERCPEAGKRCPEGKEPTRAEYVGCVCVERPR